MNPSQWWSDLHLRRRVMLGCYAVLLLAVAGVVVGVVVAVMASRTGKFSDRLAETGDWLAGGTLALAAVAGLVALQAYASATGLPELQLGFGVTGVRRIPTDDEVTGYPMELTGPFVLHIFIKNVSAYSARNPAIVMGLLGSSLSTQDSAIADGWTVVVADLSYMAVLQWDGGPVYSIHGRSVRILRLQVGSIRLASPDRRVRFELLAEGYRREVHAELTSQVPQRAEWI